MILQWPVWTRCVHSQASGYGSSTKSVVLPSTAWPYLHAGVDIFRVFDSLNFVSA